MEDPFLLELRMADVKWSYAVRGLDYANLTLNSSMVRLRMLTIFNENRVR